MASAAPSVILKFFGSLSHPNDHLSFMMESNEVERLKNDSYSTGFCQQPSDKDQGIILAVAFVVPFIVVYFFLHFLIKKNFW